MPAFFIITIDACFCSSEKMDYNISIQSAGTLGTSSAELSFTYVQYCRCSWITLPEAEFLDEIKTKVIRVYLQAIHSHLYLQLCLEISISSNSRNLLQFLEFSYCTLVRRKVENLIKNHTPFLWSKKSIQNPQVWELSKLCQKPQRKLYVHEFGFCTVGEISSAPGRFVAKVTFLNFLI